MDEVAKRKIFCEDAIAWLQQWRQTPNTSFVCSLPDFSEFNSRNMEEWKFFFIESAKLVLEAASDDCVSIFYQSDIKNQGTWVDKGFLCQKAAESLGHQLLWHKIVCRHEAGRVTYGRPSYSHILCFSKKMKVQNLARSTCDVIPHIGKQTWARGMGIEAALMIAKFVKEETPTRTLVNPFSGEGAMLAAANFYRLDAVGIERSPKRCKKSQRLSVSTDQNSWIEVGEESDKCKN